MTIAANSKCAVCGFDFAGCGESEGDNVQINYSFIIYYFFNFINSNFRLVLELMKKMIYALFFHIYIVKVIKNIFYGVAVWVLQQLLYFMVHIVN